MKSEIENYKSLFKNYSDEDKELLSYLPTIAGIHEFDKDKGADEDQKSETIEKYPNPFD